MNSISMKTQKTDLRAPADSVMMTLINIVPISKKMFFHMNTWMNMQNSIKHRYQERNNFTVT